jgi:hypothetical protein
VEKHIEWGEDGNIIVVKPYCPMLHYEYERYHWPERKPDKPPPKRPVEVDDHSMDDNRYLIWNLYKMNIHTYSGEIPMSELQKLGQHPHDRELAANKRRQKSYPSKPGGSTAEPGYVQRSPFTEQSTVRQLETPTVRS